MITFDSKKFFGEKMVFSANEHCPFIETNFLYFDVILGLLEKYLQETISLIEEKNFCECI